MRFLVALAFAVRVWGAPDSQLLALLPEDAERVMGMNLDESHTTPFGDRARASMMPLERLPHIAGLDLAKDLVEFAGVSANPTFFAARIRATAKPTVLEGKAEDYRGYRMTLASLPPQDLVIVILDRSVLLMGEKRLVKAAIDQWLDKSRSISVMVEDAKHIGSSMAWAMARGPQAAAIVPGTRAYVVSYSTPHEGQVMVRVELGFPASGEHVRETAVKLAKPGAQVTVDGPSAIIEMRIPEQQAALMLPSQ